MSLGRGRMIEKQPAHTLGEALAMDRPPMPHTYADILRTLGQELDREREQLGQIHYDGHGFRVSAAIDGAQVQHYFGQDELHQLSRQRRSARKPTGGPPGRPRLFG